MRSKLRPRTPLFLRRNIELNGIKNVTIVERALAEAERTVSFVETSSGAGNHIISPEGVKHAHGNLTLKTTTIDNFMRSGFKHRTLDFIKMDIEGYEPAALLGAQNTISQFAPRIFLEINGFTLLFAHRFNPIDFIEFLWANFNPQDVESGGKLVDLKDIPAFIYQNMVMKQCVSDLLLTPNKNINFRTLRQIISAAGRVVGYQRDKALQPQARTWA